MFILAVAVLSFAPAGDGEPQPPWDELAQCESGGNWQEGGGGYDGGLQFADSTWDAMGGEEFAPSANQATREQQIIVAERTLDEAGWSAWPGCSAQLGLSGGGGGGGGDASGNDSSDQSSESDAGDDDSSDDGDSLPVTR